MGGNVVAIIATSLLIGSSSFLGITRATIPGGGGGGGALPGKQCNDA